LANTRAVRRVDCHGYRPHGIGVRRGRNPDWPLDLLLSVQLICAVLLAPPVARRDGRRSRGAGPPSAFPAQTPELVAGPQSLRARGAEDPLAHGPQPAEQVGRRSESGFLAEIRRDWPRLFPHLPDQPEINRRARWLWGAFEQLRSAVRSTLWAGSFLAELGKERAAPFLEGGELGAELFELAVDAGQFGPCLLLADVPIAVQGSGEVLDLAAQQAQPRVSVHRGGRYWSLPASIAS
jgi:hypothetical protein